MSKTPIRPRVLLVEDEAELAKELADYIQSNGVSIRTCGSVHEALKQLDLDPGINVVVTDIALGGLSGLELLRKLRQSKRGHDVQTIVFSGYTSTDNLLAALRLGAVDFLPKPVGVDELLDAVRRAASHGDVQASKARSAVNSSKVLLEVRRKRDSLFGAELFEDPAWNMLLDLHESTVRGLQVSVTDLCAAAGTSPTTALRRLSVLEQLGLVERVPDTQDRRRVFVCQTQRGADKMNAFSQWFQGLVHPEQ